MIFVAIFPSARRSPSHRCVAKQNHSPEPEKHDQLQPEPDVLIKPLAAKRVENLVQI